VPTAPPRPRAAAPPALDPGDASRRRGQVYIALAAIAWSTAGVLQRQLSVDTATQVGGRAVFAALALLAYVAVAERGGVARAWRSIGIAGIGLAVCLAAASCAFILALNETTVARVLFIQAIAPVLAALLAAVLLREPIGRRTAVALGLAVAGVAIMLGAPGGGTAKGDLLALAMALSFALALVITRYRRDVSMAPATCLSQVLLVVVFLPFATLADVGGQDVAVLAALGAGQIGLGLIFLTLGARLIPAAQVGLITLLEVVLGPLWVWLALDERPGALTLVGGAVVVAAIVIQTRPSATPQELVTEGSGR
jgi:drug/metabolite transporter (DMT)-like permease